MILLLGNNFKWASTRVALQAGPNDASRLLVVLLTLPLPAAVGMDSLLLPAAICVDHRVLASSEFESIPSARKCTERHGHRKHGHAPHPAPAVRAGHVLFANVTYIHMHSITKLGSGTNGTSLYGSSSSTPVVVGFVRIYPEQQSPRRPKGVMAQAPALLSAGAHTQVGQLGAGRGVRPPPTSLPVAPLALCCLQICRIL